MATTTKKLEKALPKNRQLFHSVIQSGLTQTDMVRATGFSSRTVSKWATGVEPVGLARKVLTEVGRILEALEQVMDAKSVAPWLKEPNQAFDGSTPLQVMERGESDRIWQMIYLLRSGNPG